MKIKIEAASQPDAIGQQSKGLDWRKLWTYIGPGMLMAGAAVGTSHIVQSTRAGTDFGFQLLGLVLLINLLKYPFFEYGHRYAIATGENLLDGYKRMGKMFLYLFLALAVISAVASTAAVAFLSAAILQYFLGYALPQSVWAGIIMAVCALLLIGGRYRLLDSAIKAVMAVLVVVTVVALVGAVSGESVRAPDFVEPDPWTLGSLAFLVALMGWMPAPIEVSVFQSLWVQAQGASIGRRVTKQEGGFDFNLGYGLSTVLAVAFLSLGALALYGTGTSLAASSGGFVAQFVDVYVQLLGSWAGPLIALAAFAAMFSTTLTVIDGYSRALTVGGALVDARAEKLPWLYLGWIAFVCLSALMIIVLFAQSLTGLIDIVTIMAFLSAPIYGYLNFRLIMSSHTPDNMKPGRFMYLLSWAGMIFFVLVGVTFIIARFML
jgi:Mn2+/Fe2+ NRAMP family transporter